MVSLKRQCHKISQSQQTRPMAHTWTQACLQLVWLCWKCCGYSPSESQQGAKRQRQSMKFINENWNAFYSFLITRIVAPNWAGVSGRDYFTLGNVLLSLCICIYINWAYIIYIYIYILYINCCKVCMWARKSRERQLYKERELDAEKQKSKYGGLRRE